MRTTFKIHRNRHQYIIYTMNMVHIWLRPCLKAFESSASPAESSAITIAAGYDTSMNTIALAYICRSLVVRVGAGPPRRHHHRCPTNHYPSPMLPSSPNHNLSQYVQTAVPYVAVQLTCTRDVRAATETLWLALRSAGRHAEDADVDEYYVTIYYTMYIHALSGSHC
jgi:hypothetical protein